MRCPNCGGIAEHIIITDCTGNIYYQCSTGLTSFGKERGGMKRSSHIISCDTILNNKGIPLTGTIAYRTGEEYKTLSATNGKERR